MLLGTTPTNKKTIYDSFVVNRKSLFI